jgi:hypothetical protein
MLNSSPAAVRLAPKIDCSPVMTFPVKAQAVKNVAAIAGMTMFFRVIMTAMITIIPARYIQ